MPVWFLNILGLELNFFDFIRLNSLLQSIIHKKQIIIVNTSHGSSLLVAQREWFEYNLTHVMQKIESTFLFKMKARSFLQCFRWIV